VTTIVSSMSAASSPLRASRAAAYVAVASCAAVFVVGLVLWAREDDLLATHWALPSTWSDADLRRVTDEAGISLGLVSTYLMLLETLLATAGVVAALLLLRGARSWFRLYIAVALALWVTLGGAMAVVYEDALGETAGAGVLTLQGIGWLAVFPAAYLFPDGRFVPPWTRWVVLAWPAYFLYLITFALLGHGSDPESLAETAPLLVLFGSALYAAAHRYRRVSTSEQQRQTRGVVAAIALWFAVALVSIAPPLHGLRAETSVPGLVANGVLLLAGYLAAALLPVAIAVAVLRYRLYEVDTWVSRTLIYAMLTALIVLAYAALVALGGLAWSGDNLAAPLAATVVIAVVLHPLRLRVQSLVDRFVYGRRKERYEVLADLGRQLEAVVPPDQVLRTLAREVGQTLKLPYVAATHGTVRVVQPDGSERPPGRQHVFPIRWQDEELGDLTVVVRPGDELSVADRDLLAGLTRQAGAAVRAATLNDDLRRSRERILVAREDERRRLQRDLHDGLGPTLASLYQRVDAARSLLGRDPAAAEALLLDVGEQTKLVIADIRRLVQGLRPHELDELGLAGSMSAAAARFDGMRVTVNAADLPDLPPVIQIAAYRIAMEALTNAARHSGARSATVCLDADGDFLVLTVTDDGRGLAASDRLGTGLRSMRERADELGGTCGLVAPLTGGTQVRALLPLVVAS
jgi:two-component system, NarL family, sensor kinase